MGSLDNHADGPIRGDGPEDRQGYRVITAGADWQMIYYAGAKHSFTDPAADDRGLDGAAYNANADRRSWGAMQAFFQEIFR